MCSGIDEDKNKLHDSFWVLEGNQLIDLFALRKLYYANHVSLAEVLHTSKHAK